MFDISHQSTKSLTLSPLVKAGVIALVFHVALLALIPDVPQWTWLLNTQNRFNLYVTLEQQEQETFEQNLRNNNENTHSNEHDSALVSVANSNPGDNQTDLDPSQEAIGTQADTTQSQALGMNNVNQRHPSVLYAYAAVLKFAKQEAARYADVHPEELARFNRSFNSRRQSLQRRRFTAYKNQYGNQYIDKGASNGDICFIKTKDNIAKQSGTFDSASTYTVHFFRCEDEKSKRLKG